ncbi:MAG: hypothetical protein AAFY22_06265 [Pseudomonadota bacterium]
MMRLLASLIAWVTLKPASAVALPKNARRFSEGVVSGGLSPIGTAFISGNRYAVAAVGCCCAFIQSLGPERKAIIAAFGASAGPPAHRDKPAHLWK